MKDIFTLEEGEKRHPLWLKLMKHFEGRLASLRVKNDSDLTLEDTIKVRGQIAELKAIMALDKPLKISK